MIDAAIAQLLTVASNLPAVQVRPTTESVRVTDGVVRILFTQIDADRTHNDDGPDGLIAARYQLDYYAPQLSTARTLADTVRRALENHHGTTAGVVIVRIAFVGDRFTKALADAGANNTPSRFTHDVTVTYREPS